MLALAILILGITSRIVVHWPNFTPVVALALFGGIYLKKDFAVVVPLLLMAVSDFFIGFHPVIFYTWGSLILIALIGAALRDKARGWGLVAGSLLAAVLFFLVTNFGAWLSMYPKTAAGFVSCYVAAVPFFRNTLLSTVIYTVLLSALYEAAAFSIRNTRLAKVMLTR